MNVLIIGSGGREHAMAWKVAQSPRLTKLYIAPGNAGTRDCGENDLLDVTNHADVVRFCKEKQIDLVLIGPEITYADRFLGSASRCWCYRIGNWQRRFFFFIRFDFSSHD